MSRKRKYEELEKRVATMDKELKALKKELEGLKEPASKKRKVDESGRSVVTKKATRRASRETKISNTKLSTVLPAKSTNELKKIRNARLSKRKGMLAVGASASKLDYCKLIIHDLLHKNSSWPFLFPVDPVALGLLNYFTVIKKGMDLTTIEKKLQDSDYSDINDFANDVRLVWKNAMEYNLENSDIYNLASDLKGHFEVMFSQVDRVGADKKQKLDSISATVQTLTEKLDATESELSSAKLKDKQLTDALNAIPEARDISVLKKRAMTFEELVNLRECINSLDSKYAYGLNRILQADVPFLMNNKQDGALLIDIDSLPTSTLVRLEAFYNDCKALDAGSNLQDIPGTPTTGLAADMSYSSSESSDSTSEDDAESSSEEVY